MGQYYYVFTEDKDKKVCVFNRYLNKDNTEEYTGAKLMEHSYIHNWYMDSISSLIYKNPLRIAWVGDYSCDMQEDYITNEDLTLDKIMEIHKLTWGDLSSAEETGTHSVVYNDFDYKNKVLVNHTKKCYFSIDDYIKNNEEQGVCDFIIHPLSLLTALGNGMGGGDYRGDDDNLVGSWAYDEISFEDIGDKSLEDYAFLEEDLYNFFEI